VQCLECSEDINVGTAGPAGLSQNTGKGKCQKTKESKEKAVKGSKMRTLFDVGVKKGKGIPQEPALPKASLSTRKPLAVPLPIMVHPSQGHSNKAVQ